MSNEADSGFMNREGWSGNPATPCENCRNIRWLIGNEPEATLPHSLAAQVSALIQRLRASSAPAPGTVQITETGMRESELGMPMRPEWFGSVPAPSECAEAPGGQHVRRADGTCLYCERGSAPATAPPTTTGGPGQGSIPVLMANEIPADHWLNGLEYEWFRKGYQYAGTQSQAIPALSKCLPGELYYAAWCIIRGAGLPDPEGPATAPPNPNICVKCGYDLGAMPPYGCICSGGATAPEGGEP